MLQWWNELNLLEQVLTCIAVPSTLILIIQTVLTLIGLGGGGDGDVDVDGDTDADFDADASESFGVDPGLRIFTVRGIVAFFALLGWVGLAVSKSGGVPFLSITVGFAAGLVAMLVLALLFKLTARLQYDGTIDYRNALGLTGTVYITIPPSRTEKGKVNVTLQGAYMELEAITDEEEPIKYGSSVTVIGISGSNTLVVKKK